MFRDLSLNLQPDKNNNRKSFSGEELLGISSLEGGRQPIKIKEIPTKSTSKVSI